ncbi:unnamed protein product [marine sediment metagenome]|uniref:Uncharacterized protein n=1 Tax=marine sediment metagenome TaxID=412755 RepID=X1FVL0_9ZZZZ
MSGIPDGLPKDKIKSYLKHDIFSEINYDPAAVISSINKGTLPVIKNQRTSFSKSVLKLADLLISKEELYTTREKTTPYVASGLVPDTQMRGINPRATNNKYEGQVPDLSGRQAPVYAGDELPRYNNNRSVRVHPQQQIISIKNKLHRKLLDEIDLKEINLFTRRGGQVAGKQEETKTRRDRF